jgi:hypothetical protein
MVRRPKELERALVGEVRPDGPDGRIGPNPYEHGRGVTCTDMRWYVQFEER